MHVQMYMQRWTMPWDGNASTGLIELVIVICLIIHVINGVLFNHSQTAHRPIESVATCCMCSSASSDYVHVVYVVLLLGVDAGQEHA